MTPELSRRIAFGGGIAIACIEACRRWRQFDEIEIWPSIFDDFVAGAFLVTGAIAVKRGLANGRLLLAAAWGFATAMMLLSFTFHLVSAADDDPSGLPWATVVAVKGVFLAVCFVGLIGALRAPAPR